MDKKKDLADKLRSSGLRPTKQRLRLAEYLFNRSKTFHFTVENLDKVINKKGSDEKVSSILTNMHISKSIFLFIYEQMLSISTYIYIYNTGDF